MASYLLKAEDGAMGRWRAAAEKEGISFADWLRLAADERVLSVRPAKAASARDLDRPPRPDPRKR